MPITARLAGLGKRRVRPGCTIASVLHSPRQAREPTRRARDADGREFGRDRKLDRSAPFQSGGSLNDISLAAPGALALSPSQFSREYARFFGSAPTKDIAKLRERDWRDKR